MPSLHGENDSAKIVAARAFARSMNILLKYARLYGFEHARTTAQFESAWNELLAALPTEGPTGLLLGVSAGQLLVDGVPLETAGERSFAQLLAASGLASVHFSRHVTAKDFARFVRAFITTGSKMGVIAEQLKSALGESGSTIRINEIRFVAEDANAPKGSTTVTNLAAELAASALGEHAAEMRAMLQDPQKLLQMITAAHAVSGGSSSAVPISGMPGGPSAPADPSLDIHQIVFTQESDLLSAIKMLTRFGETSRQPEAKAEPGHFTSQLNTLTAAAQSALHQGILELTSQGGAEASTPLLMQLAEHMAIRFALDRFERGEVRVSAVRELLDRMNREMENLRKVLCAHEEKMSRAGMMVETHADILDRQFWAAVPEAGKRSVLLSPDAWCIPPRNISSYLDEVLKSGNEQLADRILLNYVTGLHCPDSEGRRKTALGIVQLAHHYGRSNQVLQAALHSVGKDLGTENEPELEKMMGACFTRLSQEAGSRKHYGSVRQALASLDSLDAARPDTAKTLRPRIGVQDRLPEFINEAVDAIVVPEDLMAVLRCVPQAATDRIMRHFDRSARRDECDRCIELALRIGSPSADYMREVLRARQPGEASLAVGILSRIDPKTTEVLLLQNLPNWSRSYHDAVVRQIASAASPQRTELLLKLLEKLDPLVWPETLDELGMAGDRTAGPSLQNLAFDTASREHENAAFIKVKAIEALGRLHEARAAGELRNVVDARHLWRWVHPREMRIAAAQALMMIDPEEGRAFVSNKGLTASDLKFGPLDASPVAPWARQRRYARVAPPSTVPAVLSTAKHQSKLAIKQMSLGGGFASTETRMQSGVTGSLDITAGFRKVHAQVVLREERPRQVSFEIVKMELDERGKLRRLLSEDYAPVSPSAVVREMSNISQMHAANG